MEAFGRSRPTRTGTSENPARLTERPSLTIFAPREPPGRDAAGAGHAHGGGPNAPPPSPGARPPRRLVDGLAPRRRAAALLPRLGQPPVPRGRAPVPRAVRHDARSEERRVGKEGRSRWWP